MLYCPRKRLRLEIDDDSPAEMPVAVTYRLTGRDCLKTIGDGQYRTASAKRWGRRLRSCMARAALYADRAAMKSRYGIAGTVLAELRLRDQNCVYCRVPMPDNKDRTNPLDFSTIEHLYPPGNDPKWVSWCCNGCNIRHQKPLREWFKSSYCVERNINGQTVAPIIQEFLASGLKESDQLWLNGRADKYLNSSHWSPALEDGQQSIQRSTSSERDRNSFNCVLAAICNRRYDFDFRGMKAGTFGKYYGFMYWFEGDTLNRIHFAT